MSNNYKYLSSLDFSSFQDYLAPATVTPPAVLAAGLAACTGSKQECINRPVNICPPPVLQPLPQPLPRPQPVPLPSFLPETTFVDNSNINANTTTINNSIDFGSISCLDVGLTGNVGLLATLVILVLAEVWWCLKLFLLAVVHLILRWRRSECVKIGLIFNVVGATGGSTSELVFPVGVLVSIPLASVSTTETTLPKIVAQRNAYLRFQRANATRRFYGTFYYNDGTADYSNASFNGFVYFSLMAGVVYINIQNNSATPVILPVGFNLITFIGSSSPKNICCNLCRPRIIFFQNRGNLLVDTMAAVIPNLMLTEADVNVMQLFQRQQFRLRSAELQASGRLVSEILQTRLISLLGIRFRIYAAASNNNDMIDPLSNLGDIYVRDPIATAIVTAVGNGASLVLTARIFSEAELDDQILVPSNSLWVSVSNDANGSSNLSNSPIEAFAFGSVL